MGWGRVAEEAFQSHLLNSSPETWDQSSQDLTCEGGIKLHTMNFFVQPSVLDKMWYQVPQELLNSDQLCKWCCMIQVMGSGLKMQTYAPKHESTTSQMASMSQPELIFNYILAEHQDCGAAESPFPPSPTDGLSLPAAYFFSLPPPPFFLICAHYSTTVLFHTTHTWLCCRLLETQENATTPHLKLYNALHLGSLESKAPYQSNTFLTHMNLDNTCSFELSFGLTGHIMENSMVINHEIQCKSSTRKSKHW